MTSRAHILGAVKLADAVLKQHDVEARLREGYTRVDPFEIAERAGVFVMLRPLEKLLGAFLPAQASGILLNSERPPGLVHMTCAHELGHFFLEHGAKSDFQIDYQDSSDSHEAAADWFAYHLLMPRFLLVSLMKRKGWGAPDLRNPGVVYQLSLRLGMSYSAAAWSLCRQNLLDVSTARSIAKIPPQKLKHELAGDEAKGDVWLLDQCDKDLILEPRPTDTVIFDLPDHATSGYLWSVEEARSEGFVLNETVEFRSQTGNPNELWLGRSGTRRYRLERNADEGRLEPGVLEFSLCEARPWIEQVEDGRCFATSAQIEVISKGLTPASRSAVVEETRL